ncbi:apolipoprotein D-like [Megalops cyprinoides]|uniref:apolipoprotein D-like n=1 Tax=Megalops cyprinoides TaxID=118141 RepID=UPI0018648F65|nr:apolipoprotein D-like [Megalops cyprinoides]
MQVLQALLLTLGSLLAVNGQSFHLGRCPKPPVQLTFDVAKYMGRWYEIEKLPAAFELGKCNQATYTLKPEGVVQVVNAELLSDGIVNEIVGTARVKDPSQPAILEVSFFEGAPSAPYWVLSTDYENYSLVYSCTNYLGFFYVDFAWILSRSRTLAATTVEQLRSTLTYNGISVARMTATDQTGCAALSRSPAPAVAA